MQKLYVVTRKDLTPGSQLAQSIHAATMFMVEHREIAEDWMFNSNYVVALSVDSETDLVKLMDDAVRQEIKLSMFFEPDLEYRLTAICLEPTQKSKEFCSNLTLALK